MTKDTPEINERGNLIANRCRVEALATIIACANDGLGNKIDAKTLSDTVGFSIQGSMVGIIQAYLMGYAGKDDEVVRRQFFVMTQDLYNAAMAYNRQAAGDTLQ